MVIGLDTGYFIALMRNDQNALEHWNSLKDSEETAVIVSVLTIGEILYIAYRTGDVEQGENMVSGLKRTTHIVNVDLEIIERAARLKAGRGIPYTDAIILSTFLTNDCEQIHTKDRTPFQDVKNKGVNVIFW